MLGSDFSMEAWQETGSSGGGGGYTSCLLREKRERFTDRTYVLYTLTTSVGGRFLPVQYVISATPASNTFTVITESGTSP